MGQNHASCTSDVLAVCRGVCLYCCLPQQHSLAPQEKSRLENCSSSLRKLQQPHRSQAIIKSGTGMHLLDMQYLSLERYSSGLLITSQYFFEYYTRSKTWFAFLSFFFFLSPPLG